jgi:hypothetical protein
MAPARFQNHSGTRFAAFTLVIGSMRTEKNIVDRAARTLNSMLHAAVHLLQDGQGNHLPPDDGLVGNDDQSIPGLGKLGKGLQTARQKVKLIPAFDVVGRIGVDHTVTVQKYDLVHHFVFLHRVHLHPSIPLHPVCPSTNPPVERPNACAEFHPPSRVVHYLAREDHVRCLMERMGTN